MMRRLLHAAAALLLTLFVLISCGDGAGVHPQEIAAEPKLESDPALLDAALLCTPFASSTTGATCRCWPSAATTCAR
jgi:hypothetical protein